MQLLTHEVDTNTSFEESFNVGFIGKVIENDSCIYFNVRFSFLTTSYIGLKLLLGFWVNHITFKSWRFTLDDINSLLRRLMEMSFDRLMWH